MIDILVVTHSNVATNLIEAAERVLGKQTNVTGLNLQMEDSLEALTAKLAGALRSCLEKTDSGCDGVLVLTDLFGSTPTNASLAQVRALRQRIEVLAGVNMPMIMSAIAYRNKLSLEQLAEKVIADGIKGIRNAKSALLTNAEHPPRGAQGTILYRIDDRLIHGQVVEAWLKHFDIRAVLVISDSHAKDETQKALLTAAASGVHVVVTSVQDSVEWLKRRPASESQIMVLMASPQDARRLLDGGLALGAVNLGGLHHADGTRLSSSVSLSKRDCEDLRAMAQQGVRITAQSIPDENSPDVNAWLKANVPA